MEAKKKAVFARSNKSQIDIEAARDEKQEEKTILRQKRSRVHLLASAEPEQVKRHQLAQKTSLPVLTAILQAALPALSSELANGSE